MIEDILTYIGKLKEQENSIREIHELSEKILSSDPNALDNNIAEYYIREKFGDEAYTAIRSTYLKIISNPDKSKNRERNSNNQKMLGG